MPSLHQAGRGVWQDDAAYEHQQPRHACRRAQGFSLLPPALRLLGRRVKHNILLLGWGGPARLHAFFNAAACSLQQTAFRV